MNRSRKLALTNWTKANDALNLYFEGNKSKLAVDTAMSRTTITAFFKREPVREAQFRKLCLALKLNWQEVSTIQTLTPQPENETDPLQQVREHCRQKILSLHSRMRLLSGEEIRVDQLYVDVWVLNRSPRTFQVSQDKLLQTFDLRNDRLGLGDRIRRSPGLEVANTNPKLLILGKPGAGKTTFLKLLAVNWCMGRFQSDLIAVFIELRRIPNGQRKLLDTIRQELGLETLEQTEMLLKQGNLLVLMDGLDEVPTNELRRKVQEQIQEITGKYADSRWILTCRTQVIEPLPVGFTSVEVSDFSQEQGQQFVQNWFQASGQSDAQVLLQQWKKFDSAVSRNPALKELMVTPVLLSLMCLVFHDEGEMPFQVTELYKRGIRLLLKKWNDAKAIEAWEIGSETYRQLSVDQKETLLSKIAAHKFEHPENFVLFQQNDIATQIAEFLHLANPKEGVAVLKAMEAQHGLLIERADELWSFSHITFQEHFTVQWLTQLPSEQLAEKIVSSQWHRVVEQLVRSQQPADLLLRRIKQSIDQSISGEPAFSQFLTWVLQKVSSMHIQNNDKPAALRAFYFAHTLNLDLGLAHALNLTFDYLLDYLHTLDLDSKFQHKLKQLKDHLPDNSWEDREIFWQWWQINGNQWTAQLRQVMTQNQNIGHDWQFNEQQQQQLQRYYDANHFLVKLMQIEGAASQEVRAEIEDSLLLPWEELQRRYPETYGNS
ncbi:NACHT domain-containing protein [Pantanalinema sp. GBBB05]|uniref:NACHT domain-containing protein n=1 Tax=Pantanalinema sp. GBBB05 TaxID=2604139 RepID=UPI001DD706FB|nr:NACHT domain-containing protein [Pantanalinema sp. GBBB05]